MILIFLLHKSATTNQICPTAVSTVRWKSFLLGILKMTKIRFMASPPLEEETYNNISICLGYNLTICVDFEFLTNVSML